MRNKEKVLLAALYECDEKKLDDPELLSSVLEGCAKVLGVDIKMPASYKYHPYGVTSVKIIAESLLSISTYPEHRSALVYLSSCNLSSNMRGGLAYIKASLFSKECRIYYEEEIPLDEIV